MSRRKQAKPRALKRELGEEEEGTPSTMLVEEEANKTQEPDDKDCPQEETTDVPAADSTEAAMETDDPPTEGAVLDEEDEGEYHCETCNTLFSNLNEFMDHRNYDCGSMDVDWKVQLSPSSSSTPSSGNSRPLTPSTLAAELDKLPSTSGGSTEQFPHACQFCDLSFSKMGHLKKHEQLHADQLPYKCDYCWRSFRHKRSRDRHHKLHTGDKKFSCNKCKANFSRSDHLKLHMKSHLIGSSKNYPCSLCARCYNKSSALQSHLRKRHLKDKAGNYLPDISADVMTTDEEEEETVYECDQCGAKYNTSAELKIHKDWHVEMLLKTGEDSSFSKKLKTGEFQCSQCKKSYETEHALFAHVEHMHGSGASKCPICPRYFQSLQEMYLHMAKSHIPPTPMDTVFASPKASSTPHESLSHHSPRSSKTYSVKVECPYCGKDGFPDEQTLDDHIQNAHMKKDDQLYLCQFCERSFSSMEQLTDHVRLQHASASPGISIGGVSIEAGEMKYPCQHCPMDFASSESLRMHKEAVHTGSSLSKPASASEIVFCAQCTMGFPNIYVLAEHVHNVHGYRDALGNGVSRASSRSSTASVGHSPEKAAKGLHVVSPDGLTVQPIGSADSRKTPISSQESGTVTNGPLLNSKSSISKTTCHHCNATFPDTDLYECHMKNVHNFHSFEQQQQQQSNESQIICPQCNAPFTDILSYQSHVKKHHNLDINLNKYTCSECAADFASEEQLENHVICHFLSLATEYGCTSCLKLFSKPDELQKHLMDIHAHHLYRCSLCKEVFDSKVNIQVHFAIKHSNECKLYRCTMCTSVFRSEMEWQLHVKVQHLGISKPYRCFFCKDSFSSESEKQQHIASAHKKQYQCPMCTESFYVEYQLDKHMQTKHASSGSTASASPISSSHPHMERALSQSPKVKPEQDPDVLDYSMTSPHKVSPRSTNRASPSSRKTSTPSMTSSLTPSRPPMTPPTLSHSKKGDLVYKCEICDVKFCDEGSLQKHRTHDHSIGPEMSLLFQRSQQQNQLSSQMLSPKSSPPSDKFSQLCVYCNQTFKTKGELEKHMKTHVTPSNQKCNICDDVFPSATILAEHKLTHCKVVKGNMCTVCKVAIKNEEQFYTHSQQHGFQGTNMQCVICRQTLASMLELQMHGRHHFQSSTSYFTCCVCVKSFDTKENLVSKLNTNGRTYYVCKPCYHGEVTNDLQCPTCGFKADSTSQLETHVLAHKRTYQCIKCQQSFASEYEIQLHVASHMMQEGNVHECRICNNNFESPAKLQCHLIEHTFEGSEIKCYVCDAMFTLASAIQTHVLEHGTGARRYSCSQCHQRFFFSAELQNHLYVDHKMQPSDASFQCPDCSKVFTNIINLNNHCKLHNKGDNGGIRCTLCPEIFSSMLEVQQHVFVVHSSGASAGSSPSPKLTPTKVPPAPGAGSDLRCPECLKECSSPASLQHHIKLHASGKENRKHAKASSGSKAVNCMVCNKSFSKRSNLKEHMLTHFSKAGVYTCNICSEPFPTVRLLWQHQVFVHNKTIAHACRVCGDTFSKTPDYTAHMQQIHSLPGTPGDNWDGGAIITAIRNHDSSLDDSGDSLSMLSEYSAYFQKSGLLGDGELEGTNASGAPTDNHTLLTRALLEGAAAVQLENGVGSASTNGTEGVKVK